jgi:hypothetical protein
MLGLWQSFGDPLPELQARYNHSFADELREALSEYWTGALSLSLPSSASSRRPPIERDGEAIRPSGV